MNLKNFLLAISLIMAFGVSPSSSRCYNTQQKIKFQVKDNLQSRKEGGSNITNIPLSSNGVSSDKSFCPIQFPQGFFCDLVCQKWNILTGNTMSCFISHQGQYQRFIARNPAFGIWRFYKVDLTSHVESLCEYSVIGDEFFLNDTEIMCPKPKAKRYQIRNDEASRYRSEDSTPFYRHNANVRVPMDAICELATTQFCRHSKIINCEKGNSCCYSKIDPSICYEESTNKFTGCYQALYNVMTATSAQY